ncbi:hypothetical protein UFOVP17_36 [uncultured Caudovirales phage]|uniref:Phge_HK97_gp10, phage protein, HK97 gp10 family n=1 Tax=uncultured Caudovirales phage TaxID=2100421 RepID=A0A6J5KIP1_9CAUD|nr:hypothetical protein UFOVP17_36 [uncultured Caudovirales phage]
MGKKTIPTEYMQTGSMGARTQRFAITGMAETLELFRMMEEEIGDKKATSKFLVPAMKQAMRPVFEMAKTLASIHNDTGLMVKSLVIDARRPNKTDKKSKYVNQNDAVIALVTTRKIPKKLKEKFSAQHSALLTDFSKSGKDSWQRKNTYKMIRSKKRSFYGGMNIVYDGRVPANEWGTKTEFGTAHNPAQPFLRPALDIKGKDAAELLGKLIKQKIEKYRSKSLK